VGRSYSFSVIPGDTEIRIFDTDLNLTGCTVAAEVTCSLDNTTFAPSATITDFANGLVKVTLTPAQTSLIAAHFTYGAWFTCWITDPSGQITTIVHGPMRVDLGVD
jgi:hypothetical protein